MNFFYYLWLSLVNISKKNFLIYLYIAKNHNYLFSFSELQFLKINHHVRFLRYKKSIKDRVFRVGRAYLLDKLNFQKNVNVVDCGSNIGEIGIYLNKRNINFNYYCFEPLEIARTCLKFNVPKAKIFNCCLSNKNSTKTFFIKNDTNDSSLIEPSNFDSKINIECKRLDEIEDIKNLSSIYLIKIDAEGFEPEVLKGAINILSKTKFISVDCGPERNNKSTDDLVKEIIKDKFDLIEINNDRGVLLFQNKNLKNKKN